jgi:hypothetical protein
MIRKPHLSQNTFEKGLNLEGGIFSDAGSPIGTLSKIKYGRDPGDLIQFH